MIWLVVLKAEKSEAMAVASGKKFAAVPHGSQKGTEDRN